jgi:hypothetical protein
VDLGALGVVLLDEVAGDLRLDLRVDVTVGVRDPLAGERNVLLNGGGYLNR